MRYKTDKRYKDEVVDKIAPNYKKYVMQTVETTDIQKNTLYINRLNPKIIVHVRDKREPLRISPVTRLEKALFRGDINCILKHVFKDVLYTVNYLSAKTGIPYEVLLKLRDGYYNYFEYEDVGRFLAYASKQYEFRYSGDPRHYPIKIMEYVEQERIRRVERALYYAKYRQMRTPETTKTYGKGHVCRSANERVIIRTAPDGNKTVYKSIGDAYRGNEDIIKSLDAFKKKLQRDLKDKDSTKYKGYSWSFKS